MTYDWFDRVMFGLLWLLAAAVAVLLVWGGWAIYQEVTEAEAGVITNLEYSPPYTTTSCVSTGRVTTCTPITHPECYGVDYADGDDTGNDCTDPTTWESLEIGDWYEQKED